MNASPRRVDSPDNIDSVTSRHCLRPQREQKTVRSSVEMTCEMLLRIRNHSLSWDLLARPGLWHLLTGQPVRTDLVRQIMAEPV